MVEKSEIIKSIRRNFKDAGLSIIDDFTDDEIEKATIKLGELVIKTSFSAGDATRALSALNFPQML